MKKAEADIARTVLNDWRNAKLENYNAIELAAQFKYLINGPIRVLLEYVEELEKAGTAQLVLENVASLSEEDRIQVGRGLSKHQRQVLRTFLEKLP